MRRPQEPRERGFSLGVNCLSSECLGSQEPQDRSDVDVDPAGSFVLDKTQRYQGPAVPRPGVPAAQPPSLPGTAPVGEDCVQPGFPSLLRVPHRPSLLSSSPSVRLQALQTWHLCLHCVRYVCPGSALPGRGVPAGRVREAAHRLTGCGDCPGTRLGHAGSLGAPWTGDTPEGPLPSLARRPA